MPSVTPPLVTHASARVRPVGALWRVTPRIALARASLAGPDVLILDDPLSALDVHTEERVTRALHEILAGSTALVVAHRPSTVALADTVALLSSGVIKASGSHRQLLASSPEYAARVDGG